MAEALQTDLELLGGNCMVYAFSSYQSPIVGSTGAGDVKLTNTINPRINLDKLVQRGQKPFFHLAVFDVVFKAYTFYT